MAITPITPTSISGLSSLQSALQPTSSLSPVEQAGKNFSDILQSLSDTESASNDLTTSLATGGNVDLHDVMIGLEQTDVEFKVAMSIRDKLVEAYRSMMQMQV